MELTTAYLGLQLRNPLVASSSPLSRSVEGVRRLAGGGVGAVVLYSLFEEQLRREAERNASLADAGTESFGESLSYFPAAAEEDPGPRRYLSLLERAVRAVDVPVIASLNGVTPGSWAGYAQAMQDAGASAIELNIYYLPADPRISGREVERRYLDVLQAVKAATSVPIAVKLSPHFSSTGEMAILLDDAGADGLVLFNRFIQRDIDCEKVTLVADVSLSRSAEARLPRTWISLLYGRIRASLAATTGVEDAADVVKYLLAGADVVMTTSALLRHGPGTCGSAARRALGMDAPQGLCLRRRLPWTARRPPRCRASGPGARRLRERHDSGQRRRLRNLVRRLSPEKVAQDLIEYSGSALADDVVGVFEVVVSHDHERDVGQPVNTRERARRRGERCRDERDGGDPQLFEPYRVEQTARRAGASFGQTVDDPLVFQELGEHVGLGRAGEHRLDLAVDLDRAEPLA